jgi:hypothetical protein
MACFRIEQAYYTGIVYCGVEVCETVGWKAGEGGPRRGLNIFEKSKFLLSFPDEVIASLIDPGP